MTSVASRLRRPWSLRRAGGRARSASPCSTPMWTCTGQGVFHGDVHPRNLFHAADGRVHVVDFGLGGSLRIRSAAQSGGVPAFFAPEYAAATLADRAPLRPQRASEQYSVAALVSSCSRASITSTRPRRKRWFDAVCTQPPRAFRRLACRRHPRSSRSSRARWRRIPLIDMARWRSSGRRSREAVDAGLTTSRPRPPPVLEPARAVPGDAARLDLDGELDRALSRPTAAVNFGAAGIAYSFYRASCVLDRPDLLALADVWIERAKLALERSPRRPASTHGSGWSLTRSAERPSTTRPSGVHCVDGLIACVSGRS